jgi:hypothetical protein
MSVIWIGVLVVLVGLVGFIVLQRRRPEEADKIAAALDATAKKAEAGASAAAQAVKDKLGKK